LYDVNNVIGVLTEICCSRNRRFANVTLFVFYFVLIMLQLNNLERKWQHS